MKQRFISLIYFIAIFFILLNIATGYDDKTTHPALTDEIVDFYNLSFPNQQLTSQQKEWVIEGSILEDTPPRWINHFYDPINKIGWSGEYAGKYDAETVKLISQNLIAPYNIVPVSSLEWMHNEQLQAKYAFYKGAKTWERGILEMIKGNEKEGYKILGYILHLIEDASVPDHSRNDTHANELEGITDDYGSPYEEYLKQYTRQNLNIASDFYQQGLRPIIKNTIDEYLISLAEYSNKYFFSKDTINDLKYQNPKIIREDESFGYGLDENGKEFPLVKIERPKVDGKTIKIYSLKDKDEKYILSAYFSRLSRQAILNGAGVIDLFRNEIAFKKEYSPPIVFDFSIYNYFAIPRVSIAGEWIRIKNTAQAFAGQINSAISNSFSSVSNFFSEIISDDQNFQQANLQQVIENKEDTISNSENIQTADESINHNIKQSNNNLIENFENVIINEKPKLSPNFQAELNNIENKANDLNNQIKLLASQSSNNYYLTYFGGGGGGGGTFVILSASENNTLAESQQTDNSDNQQQINQDFQQNSTSTEQTASSTETLIIETADATSTDETATSISETATSSQETKITTVVISEILFDAEKSDEGKEFIELYNPTTSTIELDNWSLKYLRENSSASSGQVFLLKSLAVFGSKPEDKTLIPANGFLLIGLNDYDAINYNDISADISRNESLPNGSEKTIVILYDEQNNEIDRITYNKDSIIDEGRSLERLAFQNGECISAQNDGELLGNGCDNDDEDNFSAEGGLISSWEIRGTPNPQNYSSLPEPRDVSGSPPISNATSTDSSVTSIQILLSQLDQSSSSLNYNWIYQELDNGISGELKSLELKISPNNSAQWFRLEEFNDSNYSQLSRSFSSGNSDGILHDGYFIVRHADGSVWNQQTISDFGNEIITIEFNNLIADPEKYYRLYFIGGDYSRSVSFNGSNFDAGFGRFIGCNWKRAVGGDGWVYTYNDCYMPDFDIYFVLKGVKTDNTDLKNEDDLPIQQ